MLQNVQFLIKRNMRILHRIESNSTEGFGDLLFYLIILKVALKIQIFVRVDGKLEINYVVKGILEAYAKNVIILILKGMECFIKTCKIFNA